MEKHPNDRGACFFIGRLRSLVLSGQSIGTVFQGPGFESRWRCMFFTLVVELQTEAEEKRRADEIKVQMAKIEAEKELTLREMELKAQD